MRNIPFSKIVCDGNELAYVKQVLESGWLTTAGRAHEFERKFAEYVGVKYACAVNSCTAALHLALEACEIGPGDKVIVPTWTFTASAEIVRYLGADVVIVDVDQRTNLLTPEILKIALDREPRAKLVVAVHFGGQSAILTTADHGGILQICQDHGIRLVEDAAHAFPSRWQGRFVGGFGDATCFSFYANKTITTGEGGMLTTNDEALFKRARLMRLHGIDRDVWNRFTSNSISWEYDVVAPGYKYNMPDVNAAIGLAQLERAEESRLARQRCALFYLSELQGIDCFDLPSINVPFEEHSWHIFSIRLNENARMSRDQFIEALAQRGVSTSVHYKPLHRMTYYSNRYGLKQENFPNAEFIWKTCVSLPIYPSLQEDDLEYIVNTIKEILLVKAKEQPSVIGSSF